MKATPDLSALTLTKQTYGREQDIQKFTTPEEAVKYIRQYHWYGED